MSNHDVRRHVSRWTRPGDDPRAVAKLAILILVSLRGMICLYEGEELGLPEAELRFDQLRDPYGIRFWPAFKGRDGCRTPMPWEHDRPHGGFTTGTPWLPVPDAHLELAVDRQEAGPDSVLHAYRAALALRRAHPALARGDLVFLDGPDGLLAFEREHGNEAILCLFNLSDREIRWHLPRPHRPEPAILSAGGFERTGDTVRLAPLGHALLAVA